MHPFDQVRSFDFAPPLLKVKPFTNTQRVNKGIFNLQSSAPQNLSHSNISGSVSVPCRLGSRGSPLAVAQTELVKTGLQKAHADLVLKTKFIATKGDKYLNQALCDFGGKGLFTKEIDLALLNNQIDIGVHSSKDMPMILPDGLKIGAVLPRAHPADALICKDDKSLSELPNTARIGTSSIRRAAMLRHDYPNLEIVPLRGNVGTRIKAVYDGDLDATLLARAGLERLGQTDVICETLDVTRFIPAPGQGIVAMVIRHNDEMATEWLAPLHDERAYITLMAERGVLKALGGNCQTPLGAHAFFNGDNLVLTAALYHPQGRQKIHQTGSLKAPTRHTALNFGEQIGGQISTLAGDVLLARIKTGTP